MADSPANSLTLPMVSVQGGQPELSSDPRRTASAPLGGWPEAYWAQGLLCPPMAPIGFILASCAFVTGKFTDVLDSSTSKFANILESIACNLITVFVIFFHAIISHDYRFFLEVPPFEESAVEPWEDPAPVSPVTV